MSESDLKGEFWKREERTAQIEDALRRIWRLAQEPGKSPAEALFEIHAIADAELRSKQGE